MRNEIIKIIIAWEIDLTTTTLRKYTGLKKKQLDARKTFKNLFRKCKGRSALICKV